jgi:DNA anti-recombination protein RmuC
MMTPEQRFDRLERIVKLMIKAGIRARRQSREQDEKINMIIDLQRGNEERFDKFKQENEERFNKFKEENERRLSKLTEESLQRFAKLTESQARSDRRLDALIAAIQKEWNGESSTEH